MTLALKQFLALISALVLFTSGGLAQDTASEEQKIRQLEQQWVEAVEAKDLDAIISLYGPEGRIMPPNAEPAVGHDSVRDVWKGILELPNVKLSFEPTEVRVAESGDIAYAIGTYQLSYDGQQGRVQDAGKYIDLWEKVDGDWKVKADMFSSNLPPE